MNGPGRDAILDFHEALSCEGRPAMTAPKIIDMRALRNIPRRCKGPNMSIAASKLGLTQSAVSQTISNSRNNSASRCLIATAGR